MRKGWQFIDRPRAALSLAMPLCGTILADWMPNWDILVDWPGRRDKALKTVTVPAKTGRMVCLIMMFLVILFVFSKILLTVHRGFTIFLCYEVTKGISMSRHDAYCCSKNKVFCRGRLVFACIFAGRKKREITTQLWNITWPHCSTANKKNLCMKIFDEMHVHHTVSRLQHGRRFHFS